MKKLMILGAGTYQVPLIKQAKEMGLYVIAVSPGNYPGMPLADKVIDCDIMDEEGVLKAAEAEGIDGIISDETDMSVLSMAYTVDKLGLSGNSYDAVLPFIDKYMMRERCRELGVDTIDYRLAGSADEAAEHFRDMRGSAIIKPVDSCASKGVTMIDSEDKIESAYDEARSYSKNGKVMIEDYIDGEEFEVDSIVVDGKSKLLMTANQELFDIPNVFSSPTKLYPAEADPEIMDRILEMDRKIMDGSGLAFALTNNEYIVGKDGVPHLLEAACRGGGLHISTIITELVTGLNTSEFLIRSALGEKTGFPEFTPNGSSAGYAAFYLPKGEVIEASGIDEVEALPFVHASTLGGIKAGMMTGDPRDKRMRYSMILSAESREELEKRVQEIKDKLNITVRTDAGEEKGIIWN